MYRRQLYTKVHEYNNIFSRNTGKNPGLQSDILQRLGLLSSLQMSQLPTCFGYDTDAIELNFETKKGKILTICEMLYIYLCLSLVAFDKSY